MPNEKTRCGKDDFKTYKYCSVIESSKQILYLASMKFDQPDY